MSLTIAIDLDGTVADGHPLQFRPGAREALMALATAGHRLILHSCRCNPMDPGPSLEDEAARYWRTGEPPPRVVEQWWRFYEMRAFLQETRLWSLFADVWQAPGKPLADVFVDDKLEPPNWARLAAELAGAPTLPQR